MTLLPSNTVLGKLELLEVFEYYDFPRIFSCKNQTGQIYIVLSTHDDEDFCEWIYTPVSHERYNALCEGAIDLRSGIEQSENGFVFTVETYSGSAAKIEYRLIEQISDSELPSESYMLRSAKAPEECLFDIDVNRVAKSTRREAFNYHIFPTDARRHEIPARKLGSVLSTSQELIDALGQAALGIPTVRGAISSEILMKTRVNVCHVFKGSFGVQFQASQHSDLFDSSLISNALEEMGNLVLAADSESLLSNKLHSLRGRVASKYRRLLKELNDIESGIRFDWGAVGEGKGGLFELTRDQVARAYVIVDKIDIAMAEEIVVHGRLIGFNSRTKRYEIHSSREEKIYSGKVSDDAFISVDHPAIGNNYSASLRMLVETQSSSGDELIRWVMVGLSDEVVAS
tara:strand:- start:93715 stop:94914 length:1200 start_codon:yes stop_codon:yes gene_type:complete